MQVGLHLPVVHTLLALVCKHFVPQPPQLFASLASTASQPLFTLPSQSPKLALQVGTHRPAVHTLELEILGVRQTVAQVPQCFGSAFRLASQPSRSGLPLQSEKLAAHLSSWQEPARVGPVGTHLPVAFANRPVQFRPPLVPQPPQLLLLVLVLISQSVPLPSQSAQGGVHVATWHTLFTHLAAAFAIEQAFVQLPQCAGSLPMFVSQPSA